MDSSWTPSGKENVAPATSSSLASRRSVVFSPFPLYHPYKLHPVSSSPSSSEDVEQACLPSKRVLIRHDSSDPAALLPKPTAFRRQRPRSILKPTTHPINVVACAEEGKQRNAPRRHSLFRIDLPLDIEAKAMAMAMPAVVEGMLSSAVETLRASLENGQNAASMEPRGENDNCTPRSTFDWAAPARQPLSPPNSSSSPVKAKRAVDMGLRDVEEAYSHVATQLRRLILAPVEETIEFVKGAAPIIVQALQRELDNVLNPTAPALPDESSEAAGPIATPTPSVAGKRKKQGRSEADLRRRRVELEVGQAAIKVLGVIMHNTLYHDIFDSRSLVSMLDAVIRIPSLPTLKSAADREIIAFAAWLMGTQALPASQINSLLPKMAQACQSILASPAKANDKTRRIMTETLSAVEHLLAAHPFAFLPHFRYYLPHTLRYLVAAWPGMRTAAACTLGRLALTGATAHEAPSIARKVHEHFHIALVPEVSRPNVPRTHLTNLSDLLDQAAHVGSEMPWAITVVSILPVVTADRFRTVEEGGPKLWMGQMQNLLYHSMTPIYIRALARFAWNHLIYSWILTSEHMISLKPDKVWAMTSKPAELLFQIVARDDSHSDRVDRHTRVRTMIALLYGLSGFLSTHYDLPCLSEQYTKLWDLVISNHLPSLLLFFGRQPEMPRKAIWQLLSAIVGGQPNQPFQAARLICRPLITGAATRHQLEAVVEAAIAETIKPEEVAAFAPTWLLDNHAIVLPMLATALRTAATEHDLPATLEDMWRGYLTSIVTAWRADQMNSLNTIVNAVGAVKHELSVLSAFAWTPQLQTVADEVLRDVPMPDQLPVLDLPIPAAGVDIKKTDFELLRQTDIHPTQRSQLWASLAHRWFQLVEATPDPLEARLCEFPFFALESMASVPACVPLAVRALEYVAKRKSTSISLEGSICSAFSGQKSAADRVRNLTALLSRPMSQLLLSKVALTIVAAVGVIAKATDVDARDASALLQACARTVAIEESGALAKMLTGLVPELMKATTPIALDSLIQLYVAILDRLTTTITPTQPELERLEPFLECIAYQMEQTAVGEAIIALGRFWSDTFGKVEGLRLSSEACALAGILADREVLHGSQVSLNLSLVEDDRLSQSQTAIEGETTAYEADVSHLSQTQLPAPAVVEAAESHCPPTSPVAAPQAEPDAAVEQPMELDKPTVEVIETTSVPATSSLEVEATMVPDETALAVETTEVVTTSTPNTRKRPQEEPAPADITGSLEVTPSSETEEVGTSPVAPSQRKKRRRSSQSFELIVPVYSPRSLLKRARSGGIATSSSPSQSAATQKTRRSGLRRTHSANDAFGALPVLEFAPRARTEEPSSSRLEEEAEGDLMAKFKSVVERADTYLRAKLRDLDVDGLEALLRG